jgi:hypothetical protein
MRSRSKAWRATVSKTSSPGASPPGHSAELDWRGTDTDDRNLQPSGPPPPGAARSSSDVRVTDAIALQLEGVNDTGDTLDRSRNAHRLDEVRLIPDKAAELYHAVVGPNEDMAGEQHFIGVKRGLYAICRRFIRLQFSLALARTRRAGNRAAHTHYRKHRA